MKLPILLFFIFTLQFSVLAQSENSEDNRIVAKAGSYKITADEFRERYEFSPHPRTTNSDDTALVKKEYLYTLIAEKLLAQKAKSLKLDTAVDVKSQLGHLEKLFVRDALYHKEVSDKVKITDAEISKAEEQMSQVLLVKYLYSTDRNQITKLYSDLKNGASLDSLLIGRPEAAEQTTLGKVTYGSLEGYVEDSLYNLKPGQFTTPIYTGNRWYIFKLYRIIKEPFFNTPDNLIKIKKKLKTQEAESLEDEYLFNFLRRFQIDVDRQLFMKIVSEIEKYLKTKEIWYKKNSPSQDIPLYAPDLDKIEDSLGTEALNSIFIKYEKNPETVKQFLDLLKYDELKIDTSNFNGIAFVFSKIVKNHIQSELLTREGYKIGLENSAKVKRDLSPWESYYLSQKLESVIYDSISIGNEEAYKFFEKNHKLIYKPDEVDLEEIVAYDLETIEQALKEIDNGVSFNEAAKKYCAIDSIKQRGGQLGYLPVNKLGKLGEIAERMKIGEVYGPVKIPEGYALIKLNDIRKTEKPQDTSFVKNKDMIIDLLKRVELEKKLRRYVTTLALEYGVKINNNVFKSIPSLRINNVTMKLIGFGGRTLAFPYSPLFAKWYYDYLKDRKEIVQ